MKFTSHSVAETKQIAFNFMKRLKGSSHVLLGLTGDLGSGKTTFVQGMAKGAGMDPAYYVNSPTFTLINEYLGKDIKIIHVDLYRINKPVEGDTLGLEEYLHPGNVVVVEWPERMPELIKEMNFQIRFEIISDKDRIIHILGDNDV